MEELNFHELAKQVLAEFKNFRAKNDLSFGFWDYLPLDEEQRNGLFFDAYRKEYARATVAYFDHEKSDVVAMPKATHWADNAHSKRWLPQARQAADMLGYKYDAFCRVMFSFYAEHIGKTNKPATLENMRNEYAILHASLKRQDRPLIIEYATHPMYLAVNYVGNEFQKRYGEYLIRELKSKAAPHYALAKCLYETRQLSIVQALENFPIEVLRKARLLFCDCE